MMRSAALLAVLAGPLSAQVAVNGMDVGTMSYENGMAYVIEALSSDEPTVIMHAPDIRHEVWSDEVCLLSVMEERLTGAASGETNDIVQINSVIDLRAQRANWITEEYTTNHGFGVYVRASDERFERSRTLLLDPPRSEPAIAANFDSCTDDGRSCTADFVTPAIGMTPPYQTGNGGAVAVRHVLRRLTQLCNDMTPESAAAIQTQSK